MGVIHCSSKLYRGHSKLTITKETFLKMFSTTTKVFLVALLAISFFVISTEAKAAPEAAPEENCREGSYEQCYSCDSWTGLCTYECCENGRCIKCQGQLGCYTCCEKRDKETKETCTTQRVYRPHY